RVARFGAWPTQEQRSGHPTGKPRLEHHNGSDTFYEQRGGSSDTIDAYSTLMFTALIIGHHFSISALWKARRASGVCCSGGGGFDPRSMSRCSMLVSSSASTTAALSFSTMMRAVPLGAQMPCQGAR